MIERILIEFAKNVKQINTLSTHKPNWITRVDERGIYVETEASREKYESGEKAEIHEFISFEFLQQAWKEFVNVRTATANDFIRTRGRTSFLMAFFSQLPFVAVTTVNNSIAIQLKEFQTDDLPCEQYDKVITFLDELVNGTYDPKRISQQVDESLYKEKSNSRQDLRILGFLNKSHEVNNKLLKEYSQTENKTGFLRQLMLEREYFQTILFTLGLLQNYSKQQKKEALVELGMTIVRNSRGENLMVESVAKDRTRHLLMWLENVGIIDQKWDLTILSEGGSSMVSNLRTGFLKIMNGYLEAKRDSFASHLLGSFVRREITKEIEKLTFIDKNQYIVTGSVGQGNWASVPWIAVLNKNITTSTQRGYYIVYLFSEDMQRLYLTLAQGVTETSKEEMEGIKREIREVITMLEKFKKDDDIFLGTSQKARGYADSTAAYISYSVQEMPDEEELVEDLQEMIQYYEQYISFKTRGLQEIVEYHSDMVTSDLIYERFEQDLTDLDLIDHISAYIQSKGFYYNKTDIINLFLSLKTKPFVILSGISGTGKTKVVQWFAESLGATEENGQFTLIPVRPDWSDSSDLLGYIDIKGEFQERPLIKVLEEAEKHPERPYFVVLDEMNLARVEYYFSDFLSVIESRKWADGKIVTSALLPESVVGKRVIIPANVYVVGTVNMDETTHPLSKKVLDRANTIEFNEVKLDFFEFLTDLEEVEAKNVSNKFLTAEFLHLKDCFNSHKDLVKQVTNVLIEINGILDNIGAQVGYRVRDEICFYMAYNEEAKLLPFDEALDYQIYQKILPRLAGSDGRTEEALKRLYLLCKNQEFDNRDWDHDNGTYAKYTRCARKLAQMLRRFEYDGFTSFWL